MIPPLIKWSGSKHSQALQILSYFPKTIATYHEPFAGGCNILIALLEKRWNITHYIISDICQPLIDAYQQIQKDPLSVMKHYRMNWNELQSDKNHYYIVRDRFNQTKNPLDFIFLTRTCTNGLIRFNQKGEFNSSFHITRDGIHPKRFDQIISRWHPLLKSVEFRCCDYRTIHPNSDDFIYCDPPYDNSQNAMYEKVNPFDPNQFFQWLESCPCNYIFSLNGKKSNESEHLIPKSCYDYYTLVKSGVSSYRRVMQGKNIMIYEYLYFRTKNQKIESIKIPKKITEFIH